MMRSASETATFKSVKSRVFQFERPRRSELNIFNTRGLGDSTMTAKATIDRQSQFAPTGDAALACGPQPNSNCGQASFRLTLLLQGGRNQVSFALEDLKGYQPNCPMPLAFGFPDILPPKDYENHST